MWDKPFVLHTDASAAGVGAALTQEHEGVQRVIAYASHRWSATDARPGATERECMAVLWAVAYLWAVPGGEIVCASHGLFSAHLVVP